MRRAVRVVAEWLLFVVFIGFGLVFNTWFWQPVVMDVEEDNAIVWVCLVDGNGECGEGQPWVDVRWPW